MEPRIWQRSALIALLIMTTLGVWLDIARGSSSVLTGELAVHFLNVGQGDATLIESPEGLQVLIDGGPDASVLRGLSSVMGFTDRTIDVVIATHPDSDHIGGLIDVLERYEVGVIITTEQMGDTPTAAAFNAAVASEGAERIIARAGQVMTLGASTTLTILFPDRAAGELESNASSIVTLLRYGSTEFLLTGDAPASIEEHLVRTYGTALASEVLKVGHHGSDTSSDADFLTAAAPTFAVISAGADNRYGHPHPDVMARLQAAGPEILETARLDTITFMSDGTNLRVLE